MSEILRLRVVALLTVFGLLVVMASYGFGAPTSVALLLPAIALVGAVTLTRGRAAALITAALAAAAFLCVELVGGTEPLGVGFGTSSLPDLLKPDGSVWPAAIIGVAALLAIMPVIEVVGRGLTAGQAAETAAQTAPPATPVAVTPDTKPVRKRSQRTTSKGLAEMVSPESRDLPGSATLVGRRHRVAPPNAGEAFASWKDVLEDVVDLVADINESAVPDPEARAEATDRLGYLLATPETGARRAQP